MGEDCRRDDCRHDDCRADDRRRLECCVNECQEKCVRDFNLLRIFYHL